MPIYSGSNNIDEIQLGDVAIAEVYSGANLVWTKYNFVDPSSVYKPEDSGDWWLADANFLVPFNGSAPAVNGEAIDQILPQRGVGPALTYSQGEGVDRQVFRDNLVGSTPLMLGNQSTNEANSVYDTSGSIGSWTGPFTLAVHCVQWPAEGAANGKPVVTSTDSPTGLASDSAMGFLEGPSTDVRARSRGTNVIGGDDVSIASLTGARSTIFLECDSQTNPTVLVYQNANASPSFTINGSGTWNPLRYLHVGAWDTGFRWVAIQMIDRALTDTERTDIHNYFNNR